MNQYQWTFLDNKRGRHTLGIAHSATSGHLVVHCDHRVVLIDFGVLEPRTFSFFIEEELCRLQLSGTKEDGFSYDFHIDTETDTEVNRERNERQRSERVRSGLRLGFMMAGVLSIVLGVAYWGYSSHLARLPFTLRTTGIQAVAEIMQDGNLEFLAGLDVIRGMPVGQDKVRLAKLSLKQGTQLPVLFDRQDGDSFIVNWPAIIKVPADEPRKFTAPAYAVISYLTDELPASAGSAECALYTAEQMNGPWSTVSLLDAFVLQQPQELEKWHGRFRESAYQNRLQSDCPARDKVTSPLR